MRHRRIGIALLAAATAIVLLGGCMGSPESARPESSPTAADAPMPSFDVTFRWASGPVVDLRSAEGIFLRGYVESFEIANAAGISGAGYRGFAAASPSNIEQMLTTYPSTVSATRPVAGSVVLTPLRRVDEADWTRIILCRHGYRSIRDENGTWTSKLESPRPIEIDFRRVGANPPTEPRGTSRMPTGNVFGGWYATRYDFAAVYPTPTDDQLACDARKPVEITERGPVHSAKPWPTLPPNPGWAGGRQRL